MTQQGDNWWDKLYDESVPETGPTATGDTLDDRFDSAALATAAGGGGPGKERGPVSGASQGALSGRTGGGGVRGSSGFGSSLRSGFRSGLGPGGPVVARGAVAKWSSSVSPETVGAVSGADSS